MCTVAVSNTLQDAQRKAYEAVQKITFENAQYRKDIGDKAFRFVKPLFHSSQNLSRKLAASAFKYCDWMKVLAARLPVGFCDEWKRALKYCTILHTMKKNG